MSLILYADDEERYRKLVSLFLKSGGHRVILAADGKEAVEAYGKHPEVALVILDAMMPLMDGWTACRTIRALSPVPIMMLTALGDEDSEVKGLKGGADDYVAKPFKAKVFLARVDAALRKGKEAGARPLVAGLLSIDAASREARVGDRPVELTHREFDLLAYFASGGDAVHGRGSILNAVWGIGYEGDPRTVDTHVKSLRAKLGPASGYIRTHRGVGYSFHAVGT